MDPHLCQSFISRTTAKEMTVYMQGQASMVRVKSYLTLSLNLIPDFLLKKGKGIKQNNNKKPQNS